MRETEFCGAQHSSSPPDAAIVVGQNDSRIHFQIQLGEEAMATTTVRPQTDSMSKIAAGVIAGLAGGIVFGMMMAMMGMLPMVAGLVGSSSALIGFLVHMVISAAIGVFFAVLFGGQSSTVQGGAFWGFVNGVIWWILGPLVIMPIMMGMGLQFHAMFTGPMLMSLLGHLIYGVVAGVVYAWWVNR